MKKILLFIGCVALLFSAENTSVMIKSENGFIMKPITPKICVTAPVKETPTGYLFTGRIIWGEPAVNAEVGDPYANGLVFVSEGKTRAWEYVGKTDDNGSFSLPIKPYTQFKMYAWDGASQTLAKYDGHFYYNSELKNLYMTPTGGNPYIADKGDVLVVDVNDANE